MKSIIALLLLMISLTILKRAKCYPTANRAIVDDIKSEKSVFDDSEDEEFSGVSDLETVDEPLMHEDYTANSRMVEEESINDIWKINYNKSIKGIFYFKITQLASYFIFVILKIILIRFL